MTSTPPQSRRAATVVAAIALLLVLWVIATRSGEQPGSGRSQSRSPEEVTVEAAFEQGLSDVFLLTEGEVVRLLPDDNEGSRHQRFVVQLDSGATVLVAHNLDLAPRIPLSLGDTVSIHGEYEWNEKGGVLHWTHADPRTGRSRGWVEHEGVVYD